MNLEYSNKRLEKICTSQKDGVKELGAECTKKLRTRLADLNAAASLEDARNIPGRLHQLTGDRPRQFALDLKHPLRLIFEPANPDVTDDDGTIDWKKVISLRVLEIVDYH